MPCADGHCQSDYITCLRAVVEATASPTTALFGASSSSSSSAGGPANGGLLLGSPSLGEGGDGGTSPIATDAADRFTWDFRKP